MLRQLIIIIFHIIKSFNKNEYPLDGQYKSLFAAFYLKYTFLTHVLDA